MATHRYLLPGSRVPLGLGFLVHSNGRPGPLAIHAPIACQFAVNIMALCGRIVLLKTQCLCAGLHYSQRTRTTGLREYSSK